MTTSLAALFTSLPLGAIETTIIDDFDEGSINVSASSGSTDGQTETGLATESVIAGIRQSEVTASSAMPTTVTSSGGAVNITYPTGSNLSNSDIYFTYNAGSNSFPAGGLDLDLTNMVAFKIDVTTPVNIFGFQLRIFDKLGNSKVATKNAFANTTATYTFIPSDFTGGSVYGNVHTIRLKLGGISSFNLSEGNNTTIAENFILETQVPPPLPTNTELSVNGAGDVTITLDVDTNGLTLLQSPDLTTAFSPLSLDPSNVSANSFTVPASTLATIDGGMNDGIHFFEISN